MRHTEDCKCVRVNGHLYMSLPLIASIKSECPVKCRCWCHKKYKVELAPDEVSE